MELIFKIAAIGMLVAILNILLEQSGRKEMALLSTIMGVVVVLVLVIKEVSGLFDVMKGLFGI